MEERRFFIASVLNGAKAANSRNCLSRNVTNQLQFYNMSIKELLRNSISFQIFSFLLKDCLLLQEFYTDDPKSCPDYCRIINQRHFKRIMALLEDSIVAVGGDNDESDCYIGKQRTSDSGLPSCSHWVPLYK